MLEDVLFDRNRWHT